MAYTKVGWQDLPSTSTPRNATNLGHMDDGIENNDKRLNGTLPMGNVIMGNVVVDSVRTKNIFDINGQVNVKANDGTIGSFNTVNGDTLTTNANNQNQYEYGQQFTNLNGKTITFSAKCVSNGTGNGGIIAIYDNYVYKAGKTITNGNTDSITYTCTSNNIIVGFNTAYGRNAQFTNIQVEISNSATTYSENQNLNKIKSDFAVNDPSVLATVNPIPITPLVGSNYSSYGDSYYYKIGTKVHIHLGLQGLTANSNLTIFTIPQGYRPKSSISVVGLGQSMYETVVAQIGNSVFLRSPSTYALIDTEYDAFN